MTLMRVADHHGHVLTYDTDDIERVEVSTPRDVIDVTPPGATAYQRKLGQEHLHLRVDFKPGAGCHWVTQAEAALPDLRRSGEFLRAALDAENIPADVASRIWNRFFYGHPAAIDAPPVRVVDEDELATQTVPADWPMPMAAILEAAGLPPMKQERDDG